MNGSELSFCLPLKSNEIMMSTPLCGLITSGYGELNANPASTTYICLSLVEVFSNMSVKSPETDQYLGNAEEEEREEEER